jgi:hypothetical protein
MSERRATSAPTCASARADHTAIAHAASHFAAV